MNKIFCFLLFFCSINAIGQTVFEYKYWVLFEDKEGNGYDIEEPNAFLSERSIERRNRQNILVKEQDLPVNQNYVSAVKNLNGTIQTLHTSRWFNALTIAFEDTLQLPTLQHPILAAINELDFVDTIQLLAIEAIDAGKMEQTKWTAETTTVSSTDFATDYLGNSSQQICMLKGDQLHLNGYDGDGILIGVMDSGFGNIEEQTAYADLFESGRYKGGFDLVELDGDVLNNTSTHGGLVLSVMAGKLTGEFIGTAPNADYMLFITEAPNEQRIEEVNWLIAAELADSAGVDLLNTSLGYADFFSPNYFDYSYAQSDGSTSIISRASDIAASKGMLVLTSAGNEGNQSWNFITFPADADSVLSIGSVSADGVHDDFSSVGPTVDGRIKPELVAMGRATALINPNTGLVGNQNGTSFSTPIVTGLAASLWESNPNISAWDLRQIILESASQYDNPDNELGYGLPDFAKAFEMINGFSLPAPETSLEVFPNPFVEKLTLFYKASFTGDLLVSLSDVQGRSLANLSFPVTQKEFYFFPLEENFSTMPKGLYFIQISTPEGLETLSIVKL